MSDPQRLTISRKGFMGSITAYAYLIPAFVLYSAFFLWPLIQLIQLSLMKWDGLQPREFVGLSNYQQLMTDDRLWLSLSHNAKWLVAALGVPILIGLILAIFLVRGNAYGRQIFRTVYFLPQIFSSVVIAIIWRWIYNPAFGPINTFLRLVGLDFLAKPWLGDSHFALAALFIAWSWIQYGFCMVIFIAALQGIDETYYDAAKVDGASMLQQHWYVTLPFIRGVLGTVVLIMAIAAFQIFDLVYIITKGGPARATIVLSIYMYDNAFVYNKIGYGAAVAVVLAMFVLIFSIIFLRIRKRMELD